MFYWWTNKIFIVIVINMNLSVQEITAAAVLFLWVGFLYYLYHDGKTNIHASDAAKTWYFFVNNMSWANFKCFYSSLANDPWGDIIASTIFGFLPLPGLPSSFSGRVSVILAKIGIYKLTVTLLLGSPNYPVTCI
jgi:hypothetical protein